MTAVVFDHGMFLELALRLGRDLKKVYYATPWETAMSRYESRVIGDGYEEIERVEDIFDVIEKVDFAVFPDVHHGGMQLYFERQGIPIWGARRGDRLELNKLMFKRLQAELGMNHADYDVIEGVEKLREHFKKEKDRWIKITPQYRGNVESSHHEDYLSSRGFLADVSQQFGLFQDHIKFLSEKPIKAKLESGLDTYCVDGKHPKVAIQGYEAKDMAYFAAVQQYNEIPEEVTLPNEYLWPILKRERFRQFLSTEVKITDDGESFLLEPTCRLPSPAGEEQMELYGNIAEIIAEGAKGNLVEPELTGQFACEAMVEHNGDEAFPRELTIPKGVRKWVKLYNTAKVGNRLWIGPGSTIIGAVVGIGDTPDEALEHLKSNAAELDGQPLTIRVEAIAPLLEQIGHAEEQGVKFSDEELPEPADALV